jgi:hypothetical protein
VTPPGPVGRRFSLNNPRCGVAVAAEDAVAGSVVADSRAAVVAFQAEGGAVVVIQVDRTADPTAATGRRLAQ